VNERQLFHRAVDVPCPRV